MMIFQQILALLLLFMISKVQVQNVMLKESLEEEGEKWSIEEETERIVNGKTAGENMFPFMVALFYRESYVCSATIISERNVLTAGHCVVFDGVTEAPGEFYGVIGNANKEKGRKIKFTDITPHPDYKDLLNDLAVLTTTEPIKFSDSVQPVCLSAKKVGSLKSVTSIGWGITTRDTSVSDTPDNTQYTNLRVYPNRKCALLYKAKKVPESIMCAGSLNTGLCTGDSGGPLVLKKGRNKYVQAGVASFVNETFGCARLLGPAGFTRVDYYREFIMKSTKGKVCLQ